MALEVHVSDSPSSATKPPLYRPPLQRSVSSQDGINSANKHVYGFNRSASLDTPGSPEIQELFGGRSPASSYDSTSANTSSTFGDSSEAVTSSSTDGPGLSSSTLTRPPPLPPPSFLARNSPPPLQICNKTRGVCVPKETMEVWDRLFIEGMDADVCIYTEDGGMTAAHSFILAASSPVFKRLLEEQNVRRHRKRVIHLHGVPYDAGRVFARFLYSSRYEAEEMEKYVMHLLVLSHAYSVPVLKRTCTEELEKSLLTKDNVVDVLKLARMCDAPRLNCLCLRLIVSNFKTVVKSEGWRVLRECDQTLEQELVGHVIEADARKQERVRKSEEDKTYKQLHDAMEALVHICRDGCRTIGPQDKVSDSQKSSATCGYPACKGLESLVRHYANCKARASGGCAHCKRMWQLLELHARMCKETDPCNVPLCRHFKDGIGQQSKKEEARWKLLVSKVSAAKGVSTGFSLAAVSATLEKGI